MCVYLILVYLLQGVYYYVLFKGGYINEQEIWQLLIGQDWRKNKFKHFPLFWPFCVYCELLSENTDVDKTLSTLKGCL